MDPRVTGAGVAMAIGMMVLLPTFNALNNSYVTDVAPPAWLAKLIDPENLPEDFQPPEDYEIPEDMELPEDFEPPPGWEIPPDYDGPIPPGGCAAIPPIVVPVEEATDSGSIAPGMQPLSWTFEIPDEYVVAVAANVTFSDWQARRVAARLEDPNGTVVDDERSGDTGGLLVPATTQPTVEFSLQFIVNIEDGSDMPVPGSYTLELPIDIPIGGSWSTEVSYAIPCGGLLQ